MGRKPQSDPLDTRFTIGQTWRDRRKAKDPEDILRDRSIKPRKLHPSCFRPPLTSTEADYREPGYHSDPDARAQERGDTENPRLALDDHNHDRTYQRASGMRTVGTEDDDYVDPITEIEDRELPNQPDPINYNLRSVVWTLDEDTYGVQVGPILVWAQFSRDGGTTWEEPRIVARCKPRSTGCVYPAPAFYNFNPNEAVPAQARYYIEIVGNDRSTIFRGVRTGYDGKIDIDFLPPEVATDTDIADAINNHKAESDPHTGYQKESEKDSVSGYAGLNGSGRVTKGTITTDDIIIDLATKGLVLKDTQGTPHYWRVTVSTLGVLTTTDLGTSPP